MRFPRMVTLAVPTFGLFLGLATCQGSRPPALEARSGARVDPVAPVAPAGPTSVQVSVRMIIRKHHGLLAQLAGNRDSVENRMTPDLRKNWWENPLVVYADAPLADPDLTAAASSPAFSGRGESANVTVELTLVPHADLALKTHAQSHAVKGTLTTILTTVSDFYDGAWTEMARVDGQPLAFAFERYTRARQKWEPRTAWPQKPESGDWRITVGAKDARLVVTTYRYVEPQPTGVPR